MQSSKGEKQWMKQKCFCVSVFCFPHGPLIVPVYLVTLQDGDVVLLKLVSCTGYKVSG